MRYEYAYKTSDGARHVEEIECHSREEAFETLRARGIRPIKVVAKDGTKANGASPSGARVSPRSAAVAVAVAAAAAACLTWLLADYADAPADAPAPVLRVASPLPRQEIHGDRRRIENVPTNLFDTAAERYLSRFAEPGRDFGGIVATGIAESEGRLMEVLESPIRVADDEFTEYVDLKRITAGIKREMRDYVRAGRTQAEYLAELVRRQRMEIDHRRKAQERLDEMCRGRGDAPADCDAVYDFWLRANAQLQSMGIYPLPFPPALRGYEPQFEIELQ